MLAAASLIAASPESAAASWDWSPRIEVAGMANDNYRLQREDAGEVEVAGALIDVAVELRSATPRTELILVPRARSTWFPSGEGQDEDSNDQFLRAGVVHRTPRGTIDLLGEAAREAVVRSELPDALVEDPVLGAPEGVDAGIVTTRNRRELLRLNPRYGFQWTPRTRLELEASWIDVGFARRSAAYVGFNELRGIAGVAFGVSPQSTLRVSASASQYEPDVGARESTTYGLQAEWSQRFSPVAELLLRAGAERTDLDRPLGSALDGSTETTWLAGIGLRWRLQVTDFFVDATRRVNPSSSGFLIERNELRLRASRRFTPRTIGLVALRGIDSAAVDPAATYRDRRYATGSVGLEWRVRRAWSVRATYDYTWQEFAGDSDDAASNAARLGFVYEPRRTE